MLFLNQFLMLISSIAAVQVLCEVNPVVSLVSLVFNFNNRGRDTLNVAVLALGIYLYYTYASGLVNQQVKDIFA